MQPRDIPEIQEAINELEEITSFPLSVENAINFGEVLSDVEEFLDGREDRELEAFVKNVKKTYTRQILNNLVKLNQHEKLTDVYILYLISVFAYCENEYKQLCNEVPVFIEEFSSHYQDWVKGREEGGQRKCENDE